MTLNKPICVKNCKQYNSFFITSLSSLQHAKGAFFAVLIVMNMNLISTNVGKMTFFQLQLFNRMPRSRIKGTKYNKITKQQKFILLRLCLVEKKTIHEAASQVDMHYSTAKTIVFFHKKKYKNFSNFTLNTIPNPNLSHRLKQASYTMVPMCEGQPMIALPTIQIVSSTLSNNKTRKIKKSSWKESTAEARQQAQKHLKEIMDCMDDQEVDKSLSQGGSIGRVKFEEEIPSYSYAVKEEKQVQPLIL